MESNGTSGSPPETRPFREEEIIYDWNRVDKVAPLTTGPIFFLDETLRDGLQSPSAVDPPVADKIMLLHTMNDLGIHFADIGLPGAGRKPHRDVLELAREIAAAKLAIRPCAAARTLDKDVDPIIEISQQTGVAIEVLAFIGTSPIRQFVEDWDRYRLLRLVREAVRRAREAGLPVTFVTEDTTRAKPDTLYPLYHVAIESGAHRICLSDTVGHATPDGLKALIRFTRELIKGMGKDIQLDWHGHNDRGMGLTNSLHAIEAGVSRVHGTALGIGERVGNAPMDQILMNLKLLGAIDNDLSKLMLYCRQAAVATHWHIQNNYPLVGADAFRTSTGVHAAAIRKARQLGASWIEDRIYSGVPASEFGRTQIVEVGPMSGAANVLFWLEARGIPTDEVLVGRILDVAKRSNRVLEDIEIEFVVRRYNLEKEGSAP
ncbi:MAG: 2-isopropylmalate synthase [Deltaproteobacteria bacterium]|nr:2-isopropylmalate synthase [Deltaproteobacteria bacterium]